MQLINTDGMAFVGPGSEWFWTALQFLALTTTFYAIYRQLRAQRSASVFKQMAAWEAEWAEPRFVRERLEFLLELEGLDPAGGLPRSGISTVSWFERLGYLVAQGHVRSRDASTVVGNAVTWWWALLAPYLARDRVLFGDPAAFEVFETLDREMQRLEVLRTGKPWLDPITVAETIDAYSRRLRREQDAAQGIIPTRKVAPPTPATTSEL
jgi:hypothetical protein